MFQPRKRSYLILSFTMLLIVPVLGARGEVTELAHYRLVGDPGSAAPNVLSDISGNKNELRLAGTPKCVESNPPGRTGGALEFNGSTDWYGLGHGLSSQSQQYVLEAWVKADHADDSGLHGVASFGDGALGYCLAQQGKEWVAFVGGVGASKIGAITTGEWVHLAIVVASGKAITFMNGREIGACGRCNPHPQFTIGDFGRGNEAFSGCIHEVRLSTFNEGKFNPLTDLLIHHHHILTAAGPDVDAMISKAKEFLYSKEQNGNWESVATPEHPGANNHAWGTQWTGLTALTTYALLASGEEENDTRIKSSIDFLTSTKTTGTYALGLRCLLWGNIHLTKEQKVVAVRDRDLLLANMRTTGDAKGLFHYGPPSIDSQSYDISASQFAPLGLAALAANDIEVPTPYWTITADAYMAHQHPDGSWNYAPATDPISQKSSLSMTAAGVASLLIAREYSQNPALLVTSMDKGIDWLGGNFESQMSTWFPTYSLFAVSRVGVSSGRKYFGQVDWYKQGLDFLASTQNTNGSWTITNPPVFPANADTSLAMLFLAYGSAPVVINKLEYANHGNSKAVGLPDWNRCPDDAYNFVHWMSGQVEARLNWQVVDLGKEHLSDCHDAPILFITGDQVLSFTDDEKGLLRQFVDEGGLILGNADSHSEAFRSSFVKLGQSLFTQYEFRQLSSDHPIFENAQFHKDKSTNRPQVLGLSNGVRELMLLPTQDVSSAFQHRADREQKALYQLVDEIVLYTTELQGLHRRQPGYVVIPDPSITPAKSVQLRRLQYAGNWNPEPGGWKQFAATMHNDGNVGLDVQAIELGKGHLAATPMPTVAHLTGSGQFTLNDVERQELSNFISAGGTLVIDAAGGSSDFAASAERELIRIFGDAGAKGLSQPLPPDNALYIIPDNVIERVHYRDFAKAKMGSLTRTPRIFCIHYADRDSVFFSREDISAGLVGERMGGIIGYTPQSATELMRNIILFSSTPKK